jgi:uncharacterized protein
MRPAPPTQPAPSALSLPGPRPERLFTLETDRVTLSLRALSAPPRRASGALDGGLLRVEPLRPGLRFGPGTFRAGVPPEIAGDPTLLAGPLLFEQCDYKLYARATPGATARIHHDDPLFARQLTEEDHGNTVHGVINFGAQIGRSTFTVLVDGAPELRIELEVFPEKITYREDYEELLAEVQSLATGLALEYLRATYQPGATAVVGGAPTELEWVLGLQRLVGDLERALRHVARSPARRLARRETPARPERIQRVDAAVRASVRRRAGTLRAALPTSPDGALPPLPEGARLAEVRPSPTLDTPEHRFLAAQVTRIRRRLAAIRAQLAEKSVGAGERRRRALSDLEALEKRLAALGRLEPLVAARGDPPPGFASLLLARAPGYREAYRACLALTLGLRVEGGPLRLAVKDVSLLYEYWCYLATARLLASVTGARADLRELFAVRGEGLEVRLERGRESAIRLDAPGGRRITLHYNPVVAHADTLIAQRPDLLLSVVDPGWPKLELLLDAKYRIDASAAFVVRHGAPGPPEDAINALHRYRDAILEERASEAASPKRRVVQAVALFPYRPTPPESFTESQLFRMIDRVGIGALPLLPGSTDYLERWLAAALSRGAWDLSDRIQGHAAAERAADWKKAAAEVVLVGLLRGGASSHLSASPESARAHLAWIASERRYYAPLTRTQRRQFVARWLALYSPAEPGQRGGVTHVAPIEAFEVVERCAIATPWRSSLPDPTQVVLYHLGPLTKLPRVIENRTQDAAAGARPPRGTRVPVRRWSSRLALDRAAILAELALETEPEWRLYEALRARGVSFRIVPGPARTPYVVDPEGRALFQGQGGAGWSARYLGGSGFAFRTSTSTSAGAPNAPGSADPTEETRLVYPEDVAASALARATSVG